MSGVRERVAMAWPGWWHTGEKWGQAGSRPRARFWPEQLKLGTSARGRLRRVGLGEGVRVQLWMP